MGIPELAIALYDAKKSGRNCFKVFENRVM
jgi:hypothetical protein